MGKERFWVYIGEGRGGEGERPRKDEQEGKGGSVTRTKNIMHVRKEWLKKKEKGIEKETRMISEGREEISKMDNRYSMGT